ncbi:DeoxyUTP pyrophosphatase [Candidatus Phytoplasma australiense]|uniref:dUTP diphosphatase n=2 Tax=Phytoplasma australiense TaxID=59748 RepID=B1VA81_PHYAS|nr:dUTP diphosphatase [Candidatus Phytoplasma australiense]AGL90231.1 Deoxyuridine 5'-triphosphate nucleotidohydrolase [Strawberry lethal yellows phytoplasma (CPA) str. NZSb11]CAM11854.1 DeoxyUTP pyrophosphatase [Candidatus Phytoplasma australiense]
MSQKKRFFEKITLYQTENINLPQRQTEKSGGYDFEAAQNIEIKPQTVQLVPTGIKAFFSENETLLIYARSSLALKKQLMMANGVGVVDSDYYNNLQNEGHIFIPLYNFSSQTVKIEKGERIAQGIFQPFLLSTNEEKPSFLRKGGFGSTTKNN